MQIAGTGAAASTSTDVQHRKLENAAEQFEAMFLKEMLRPVFASEEDEPSESTGGSEGSLMKDYGLDAASRAIAHAGGFGVAKHIVSEVEKQSSQIEATQKLLQQTKDNDPSADKSLVRRLA